MKNQPIAAVILAAGFSSRMGRFKPLLPLGNGSILHRDISLFQKAGIKDIVVVSGYRREDVQPEIEKSNVRVVFNPSYSKDMFSSVIAGLSAVIPGTEAVFVLPVDIPLVKPSTIVSLLTAYHANKDHLIYPTFKGSRGHPPLIPSVFVKDIIKWKGSGGLNGALKQIDRQVIDIEVPDENILFDIDTPEEYQTLLKKWRTLMGGK